MDREHSCAFTGHRDTKLPWGRDENDQRCLRLKKAMYDAAEAVFESGKTRFYCGMAMGCDLYFCEAVLALQENHPEIELIACVPYPEQAKSWPARERAMWQNCLSKASETVMVSESYTRFCLQKRNEYMVDRASVLIAAYSGEKGGTMNTMLYALRNNLDIIQLPIEI